jgi:hypothetical protein
VYDLALRGSVMVLAVSAADEEVTMLYSWVMYIRKLVYVVLLIGSN